MKTNAKIMLAVVGMLALAGGGARAQGVEPGEAGQQVRQQTEQQLGNAGQGQELRTRQRQRIYGEELMTLQERNEYQQRLQDMKSEQERQAFEQQHRKAMQARAERKGKKLGNDGSVLAGDRLHDRDRNMDNDRDRIRRTDQLSRPQSVPPGSGAARGGSGRGGR